MLNEAPLFLDLGCGGTGPVWVGVLAVLALVFLLSFLGQSFIRFLQKNDGSSCNAISPELIFSPPLAIKPLVGWGVLTLFLTISGMLDLPLWQGLAVCLGCAGVIEATRFLRTPKLLRPPLAPAAFLALIIILQLPALFLIQKAGISGWDDFSHWVPNSLYLWQNEAFPTQGHPPSNSAWPAYPYTMPFLGYVASHLAGLFLVQGGAMASWLLLILFATILIQTSRSSGVRENPRQELFLFGIASFLCTLGNPSFNASFSIMAASDTPTAVSVGALGLSLAQLIQHNAAKQNASKLNAPAKSRAATTALLVTLVWLSILLVMLRQMNIILWFALALGTSLAALRRQVLGQTIRQLALIAVPAFVLRIGWALFTAHALKEGQAFQTRPFTLWRWDLLPQICEAIAREMARKWGLYTLFLVLLICALRSFFFCPQDAKSPAAETPPTRSTNTEDLRIDLTIIAATVFWSNALFLLTAYLGGQFLEAEVLRAASFYRYSTHAGLLGIACVFLWLRPKAENFCERFCTKKTRTIFLLTLTLALLPLATIFKPNWIVAPSRPALCAARALGERLATVLPPQTKLALVDSQSNGFNSFIFKFAFARAGKSISLQNHIFPAQPAPETTALFFTGPAADLQKLDLDLEPPLATTTAPPLLLLREQEKWRKGSF